MRAAFSLVEVMIAIGVTGIVFVSLYTGFAVGFAMMERVREDLVATQVLVQQLEQIRLKPWTNLANATFTVTNEVPDQAVGPQGVSLVTAPLVFSGEITTSAVPATLPPAYRANMLRVEVNVSWTSGSQTRARVMETYVSRYGMQRFYVQ